MQFELVGATAQHEGLDRMARRLDQKIGHLIKPVQVVFRPAEDMPERSDGGVSWGFWKEEPHKILLWDEIEEYSVVKTFAHEAMHALDDDWLIFEQRQKIMALMNPRPNGWGDVIVNGKRHRYKGLPYESFAVYASARIAGIANPSYRKTFLRKIPEDKWDRVAELALEGAASDIGRGTGNGFDSTPIPPPTADEVIEELEGKLEQAKFKAGEIGQLLGAGDVMTAIAKAGEIEAL